VILLILSFFSTKKREEGKRMKREGKRENNRPIDGVVVCMYIFKVKNRMSI
jgi:hypothetical protein